jgi:hypothetical protein
VTRFGTAPPDFTAQTLINLNNDDARLVVTWRPPTAAPFTSNNDSGLVLDLSGTGAQHQVWRDAIATDLLTLGLAPTVVPMNPIQGLFALGSGTQVQIFTQWHDYSVALQHQLSEGQMVAAVGGHGVFDNTSASMMADRFYTVFQ